MADNECRERIAPIGSAESGMRIPRFGWMPHRPSNCPEYISCEDYDEQEEFYE